MQCYGHYREGTDKCRLCDYREYCKDAGDPPLSGGPDMSKVSQCVPSKNSDDSEQSEFSAGHWLELIRRILLIDEPKLKRIILMKMENPNVSFAEIGQRFGVTKQAIDKYITRAERYFPELVVILRNRPNFNRWRVIRSTEHSPYTFSTHRKQQHLQQLELPLSGESLF